MYTGVYSKSEATLMMRKLDVMQSDLRRLRYYALFDRHILPPRVTEFILTGSQWREVSFSIHCLNS